MTKYVISIIQSFFYRNVSKFNKTFGKYKITLLLLLSKSFFLFQSFAITAKINKIEKYHVYITISINYL